MAVKTPVKLTPAGARRHSYTPQDCHTLNNDGSLRQSVDTLLTLIHQKEKHHACL